MLCAGDTFTAGDGGVLHLAIEAATTSWIGIYKSFFHFLRRQLDSRRWKNKNQKFHFFAGDNLAAGDGGVLHLAIESATTSWIGIYIFVFPFSIILQATTLQPEMEECCIWL